MLRKSDGSGHVDPDQAQRSIDQARRVRRGRAEGGQERASDHRSGGRNQAHNGHHLG